MQTKVVKLDRNNPDAGIISEAAQLIDQGGLVAFPTETVYGIACRVRNDSLVKLNGIKGRTPDKFYSLHIGSRDVLAKYIPQINLRAKKLTEKAWPGPLTLVLELDENDLRRQRKTLEKEVFDNLYRNGSIGIRFPANAIAMALLRKTANAVVAPSANLTGEPPAVDAEQVLAQFDGQIEMVLNGGQCSYKQSSTVAKMGKMGLEILRPGAYSQAELKAMATVSFLFVCTGNTCRSPMAKGIFSKYLVEKMGCDIDNLEKIGYKIYSAGAMGIVGSPATPEAVAACADKGVDIGKHRSEALTTGLINKSDYIYVMTNEHRSQVITLNPSAADKCMLLAENENIVDPIGRGQQIYKQCADVIENAVKKRIGELIL